jgi:hypothetical protein
MDVQMPLELSEGICDEGDVLNLQEAIHFSPFSFEPDFNIDMLFDF